MQIRACLAIILFGFPSSLWSGTDSEIRITTTGEVYLAQDPNESRTVITAEAQKGSSKIVWIKEGPGKTFVELKSEQIGKVSQATLSLKRPVPSGWTADSYVTLVAKLERKGKLKGRDQMRIGLVKFRRAGRTAPGSRKICIELSKSTAEDSDFGYQFEPKEVVSIIDKDDDFNGSLPLPEIEKTYLRIFYHSEADRGTGEYRLREIVEFRGRLGINPEYNGFGHNASIQLAAGVAASVDNEAVNLKNNTIGVIYSGFPSTISLSLPGLNPSSAGLIVSLALVDDKGRPNGKRPKGSYVLEVKGPHSPGSEIEIEKEIQLGAAVFAEQIYDNEWSLHASAKLEARLKRKDNVHLCFNPTF